MKINLKVLKFDLINSVENKMKNNRTNAQQYFHH